MVLISHIDKYVYIHIPKTGGQTLKTLIPYDEVLHCKPLIRNVPNLTNRECFHRGVYTNIYHLTYQQLIHRNPELYQYRVFTFVRNPYDRMYSIYIYIKHNIHKFIALVLLLIVIPWALSYYLPILIPFALIITVYLIKYLVLCIQVKNADFTTFLFHLIPKLEPLAPYVFYPQAKYIEGSDPVFIGREENFQADTRRLMQTLGVTPPDKIPEVNALHSRSHESVYKYMKHYTPATLAYVNHHYHDDFVRFGYHKV